MTETEIGDLIDMEIIKKDRKVYLMLGALLVLQLMTALYFCGKKTGFHYDEYYSYYSSNVTMGLVPTDREWKGGSEIRNEFMVLPGEGFRFSDVVRMQTYDVHPPFYYLLLHTVCSLTPGIFSKWSGLGLNLFFFAVSWCILALLTFEIVRGIASEKTARTTAAAVCLLYGFNPAVISGIMLVRMYMLLGLLAMAVTWLHVRALNRSRRSWRFYLPVMLTVYLGFLTHYYFAVYMFFLAAATEFYLLFETVEKKGWGQRWKDCIVYGLAVVGAMACAVVSYPACLGHIFRGYRGTEAMGEFFDVSNTAGRIRFFVGLLNEYVFGDLMALVILAILLLVVTVWTFQKMSGGKKEGSRKGKAPEGKISAAELGQRTQERAGGEKISAAAMEQRAKEGAGGEKCGWAMRYRALWIPAAAVAGYFAVVTKTALLTAEEANRYQLPVYGMILMLAAVVPALLIEKGLPAHRLQRAAWIFAGALLALVFAGEVRGLVQNRVLFLYEEDAENIAFAKENHDVPVVYFYNGNLMWMIWDDSLELMQYDRIYFVNMADVSPVEDSKLKAADRALIYVARGENSEAALRAAEEAFSDSASAKRIRELLYCDLYEIAEEKSEPAAGAGSE